MRRLGLRAGTWALACAIMAVAATACDASAHVVPPGAGPGRQIFTMRLLQDHPRLDRGVLTYSELTAIPVRQAAPFDVQVTDVGRGPERTAFARRSGGWFVAPQDVPAGGIVSVQITCSGELTCTPRSAPARQAILGAGRSGTWTWDVAATSPGAARILLTAIRYRGNSRAVRAQAIVTVDVAVPSTPLYAVEAAVDARKPIVGTAAAVLAAAGILGGALAWRRRRGPARAARARSRADLSDLETVTWPAIGRPAPRPVRKHAPAPAVPRMRLEPAVPTGAAVTLVIWQTPEGLTCEDPGTSWVSRWTYCVSPGQDASPQFVLTGERHGCLVGQPGAS